MALAVALLLPTRGFAADELSTPSKWLASIAAGIRDLPSKVHVQAGQVRDALDNTRVRSRLIAGTELVIATVLANIVMAGVPHSVAEVPTALALDGLALGLTGYAVRRLRHDPIVRDVAATLRAGKVRIVNGCHGVCSSVRSKVAALAQSSRGRRR